MGSKRKKRSWQSSPGEQATEPAREEDTAETASEEGPVRVWDLMVGAAVIAILTIIAFVRTC